jgi:hypothetical protein
MKLILALWGVYNSTMILEEFTPEQRAAYAKCGDDLGCFLENGGAMPKLSPTEIGEADTGPQMLSRAQASTSVPAPGDGVVQIKGLHNAMDLDEVLMAIHSRGGTCSSTENRFDFLNKTVVSTSCKIQDDTRQGDWNQTDIFLSSDRTRSGLVLTHIHFNCSYTNTCGMSSNKVTEALRSAGALSKDTDGDLIRIDHEGGITLSITGTDQPDFH